MTVSGKKGRLSLSQMRATAEVARGQHRMMYLYLEVLTGSLYFQRIQSLNNSHLMLLTGFSLQPASRTRGILNTVPVRESITVSCRTLWLLMTEHLTRLIIRMC